MRLGTHSGHGDDFGLVNGFAASGTLAYTAANARCEGLRSTAQDRKDRPFIASTEPQ